MGRCRPGLYTGVSILLVEQNLYSALATADRVCVMEIGAIVHEASASALAEQPEVLLRHLGVQCRTCERNDRSV